MSELPKPLFQSEAKGEAKVIKMIFNKLENKSHFHKKGFELTASFWKWVFGPIFLSPSEPQYGPYV